MSKRDREVKGADAPTLADQLKAAGLWEQVKARAVESVRKLGIESVTAELEDAADADIVVIKRTVDGPPFARSSHTRCQRCNADCWLSDETAGVMPSTAALICYPCVVKMTNGVRQ